MVVPGAPGFVWSAEVAMPLGTHVRVVDSYVAGSGRASGFQPHCCRNLDERTALAVFTDGPTTVSLEFRFNEAGETAAIYTPGRPICAAQRPAPAGASHRSPTCKYRYSSPPPLNIVWLVYFQKRYRQ